ncbi:hypothetical protein [Blastococcus sp. SYSU DS0541]
MDSVSNQAVDRGTRAGRAVTLDRGTTRPTGTRPTTSRGDDGAPATRAR